MKRKQRLLVSLALELLRKLREPQKSAQLNKQRRQPKRRRQLKTPRRGDKLKQQLRPLRRRSDKRVQQPRVKLLMPLALRKRPEKRKLGKLEKMLPLKELVWKERLVNVEPPKLRRPLPL